MLLLLLTLLTRLSLGENPNVNGITALRERIRKIVITQLFPIAIFTLFVKNSELKLAKAKAKLASCRMGLGTSVEIHRM